MMTYPARARALATALSALAGFVDATGFLLLGGFFVSFMSGNTTRLGVGLAAASTDALAAGGLIGTFVAGVILGSLIGHRARVHRRPAVLALVSALLALAAILAAAGRPELAAVPMALAMGAENATFEERGEVRIGLTYMTGTLVKFGQRVAAALLGGDRRGWLPFALLWLGLAAGGVTGALAFAWLGAGSLWIAAAVAAGLAIVAASMEADGA